MYISLAILHHQHLYRKKYHQRPLKEMQSSCSEENKGTDNIFFPLPNIGSIPDLPPKRTKNGNFSATSSITRSFCKAETFTYSLLHQAHCPFFKDMPIEEILISFERKCLSSAMMTIFCKGVGESIITSKNERSTRTYDKSVEG